MSNTTEQDIKIAIGSMLSTTIANTAKMLSGLGILAELTRDPQTAYVARKVMQGLQSLLEDIKTTPGLVQSPNHTHAATGVSDRSALMPVTGMNQSEVSKELKEAGVEIPHVTNEKVEDLSTKDILDMTPEEFAALKARVSNTQSSAVVKEEPKSRLESDEEAFIRGLKGTTIEATAATGENNAVENFKRAVEAASKPRAVLKEPAPVSEAPEPDLTVDPKTQEINKELGDITRVEINEQLRMIFSPELVADGIGPVGTGETKVLQVQHDLVSWSSYFMKLSKKTPPVLITDNGETIRAVLSLSNRTYLIVEHVPALGEVFVQTAMGSPLYTMENNAKEILTLLKKFVDEWILTKR